MTKPTVDLKNRYLAGLLAWMVPGLGHIYQGRVSKGILYGVTILGLFFLGLALGDWGVVYWRWVNPLENSEKFCLPYVGQFFAGLPALPALIQATLRWYGYGPIPILGNYLAEPSPDKLNGLYRLGKLVEISSLYCTVAGLLNILAIYDAFDGPAHDDDEESTKVEVLPKTALINAEATV